MNKKDFQALIIPLSEKELLYKASPELSGRLYKGISLSTENIPVLTFNDGLFHELSPHGLIFPGQPDYENKQDIFFCKQTRFSVVPPHKHTYLELNYIYSGSCTACINDKETLLDTGDVCIMDVGVIHTIYPTSEDDIILNCLMPHSYFNAIFIDRLAQSGPVSRFLASALADDTEHDQYLIFHTGNNLHIRELFEDVFCEYLDPALCSSDVIDSYMTLIFIQLARCYQNSRETEYHENKRSYMTEVLRYIEDNCTDCTLKSVAEQFGFHDKYLVHLTLQHLYFHHLF